MKKFRLSTGEKKFIRTIVFFALIQFVIIGTFISIYQTSQENILEKTQTAEIFIEDIYGTQVGTSRCLVVVSDSTEYLFSSYTDRGEYKRSELKKVLSIGDRLSIICVDGHTLMRGDFKWILDARNETEVYRRINTDYKNELPFIFVVLFGIFELGLCGIVWFYISLNTNTIKGIYRKIKRRQKMRDSSAS